MNPKKSREKDRENHNVPLDLLMRELFQVIEKVLEYLLRVLVRYRLDERE
jgi:hypothetical protein